MPFTAPPQRTRFYEQVWTLCRAGDPDRRPRFRRVLEYLGAEGGMADLDDGPELELVARGSTRRAEAGGRAVELHPIRTAALPAVAGDGVDWARLRPWLFALPWGLALALLLVRRRRGDGARARACDDLLSRLAAAAESQPRRAAAGIEEAGEPLAGILARHQILLAVTELSATAPLKLAAPLHGFRAATMPGFGPAMIPALKLDYEEIHRRCVELKERLDRAAAARLRFEAGGERYELTLLFCASVHKLLTRGARVLGETCLFICISGAQTSRAYPSKKG